MILLKIIFFENADTILVVGHAVVQLLIFFFAVVDAFVKLLVLFRVGFLLFAVCLFQPVHCVRKFDNV